MDEIENAKIESTMLGRKDAPVLTAFLFLDFGGSGQGFGGYTLDDKPKDNSFNREPCDIAGLFIARVLETVGVECWEDLKGKHIRAVRKDGLLIGIGNIIKDEWFYPRKEFAAHIEKRHTII